MRLFRFCPDTVALAIGTILFLAAPPGLWAQQSTTLRGTVRAALTGDPIRFVTVELISTRLRVMTDRQGGFSLRIPRSRLDSANESILRIAFSCIGFRRDTIDVRTSDTAISVTMHEQSLIGREIIVRAEDPAVGIMRKVIDRKAWQRDILRTYTYTLYTKFIAATDTATALRSTGRGDTTINSILESFSRGFVQLPDLYHNEIFQKRQSVNIPPEANFVSFGTNLNIYDESVAILSEDIASPFALDAVDVYEYRLVNSQDDDTVQIEVRPHSSLQRGFIGTIYIDQRSHVPLEVQLQPNQAVNLPFNASLSFRQSLTVVDSMVLPEALSISSSLQANILFVVGPRLDIDISTFCYDYRINPEIDADIFNHRRVETTVTADDFDSTYWQGNLKLPLLPQEERAYQEIKMAFENPDSLQSSMIERLLGPVSRFLRWLGRRPFTGFDDNIRYNLIHGPYVGFGIRDRPDTALQICAIWGYGLADKRFYGTFGTSWFPDDDQQWSVDVSIGRILARRDDPAVVRQSLITFTTLLTGSDYGDYYLSNRITTGLSYSWGQLQFVRNDIWTRPNLLRLTYTNSIDRSVQHATEWSLFGPHSSIRPNPTIADGRISSLTLDYFLSYSPLRRLARSGMALTIEGADRILTGGDFSFLRTSWMGMVRIKTLPLWTLDLSANVHWAWGALPPQRYISSESSIGSLSVGSAFRGMHVKEFYGDRLLAIQFSHNFGEIIPGLMRIQNVASFGIEFLLFGGVQYTSFSASTQTAFHPTLRTTSETADKTYFEIGMGINRILLFLRFDINARISQRDIPELRFTLTNASF